jgi:hypothetical protein
LCQYTSLQKLNLSLVAFNAVPPDLLGKSTVLLKKDCGRVSNITASTSAARLPLKSINIAPSIIFVH